MDEIFLTEIITENDKIFIIYEMMYKQNKFPERQLNTLVENCFSFEKKMRSWEEPREHLLF